MNASRNGLVRWGFGLGLFLVTFAQSLTWAESPGVNREPALVSSEMAINAAQGGKFSPLECSYPRNLFTGPDWKTQEKNYSRAMAEVGQCKGNESKGIAAIAFVTSIGDGNDWKVICHKESKGKYVMTIPAEVLNSGKRYTVYNKTGSGSIFAVDQLPTSTTEAATGAYLTGVCTEKATVNFKVSGCKTLSFDPNDYGSKKTAKAFFMAGAARECDRIANQKSEKGVFNDAVAWFLKNKPLTSLKECGR